MFPLDCKSAIELVRPAREHLPGYIDALERGWSFNNLRPKAGFEELAQIRSDPARFLESLDDREAKGPPVALPDGTQVPRLPGYRRWMWDGEFCGRSRCAGSTGATRCPLTAWAISAMGWCRGRPAGAAPRGRSD